MMESLRALLNQLMAFWAKLSTRKRLALAGLVSAALIGSILVPILLDRVTYTYLYTGLNPQDAAGIVEKLKTAQVPYRLEGSGSAILVPEEKVAALRLDLASSGLPRGAGVGFEIFDRSQIGATEFEQQVSLRRALEGELSRSIMTIDGVESARVHLVMPERRLFATKQEAASASVVLKLGNPGAFNQREVQAIVHLVAAAVPGLSRDRVSVVGTDGVTLHRPNTEGDSNASSMADAQSERAQAVAGQMENDVREQLERVVGPGNADVRIHVDLDPSVQEQTEEHYEPTKSVLRSEQKLEELGGGAEPGVAGVPGALSNLPDGDATAGIATTVESGNVIRRSHIRNWEVDRVTKKINTPAGSIERLSAAVLINGKNIVRAGKPVTIPRTAEEVQKLEELVKRAVGFDEKRGDSIRVSSAEFTRLDGPLADLVDTTPWWKKYLIPLALGAFGLVALAITVLVWRGKRKKASATARQLAAVAEAAALPATSASDAKLMERQLLDAEAIRGRALLAASKDPATAAVVIRRWLNGPAATARS
jgi:flagellar M-ring protein FliF